MSILQKRYRIIQTILFIFGGISIAQAALPQNVADVLNLPETPYNYSNVNLPDHFNLQAVQDLDNTPNTVTANDDVATLGRVLFYEKRLSANGTVACSSCHSQASGFSDNEALSLGFNGGHTSRNSMPIANVKFYRNGHFFWDERAETLANQTLEPIQNAVEMGLTLEQAEAILEGDEIYQYLFQQAYGDSNVTPDRMADALSQFLRSILAYQSRYDAGLTAANNNVRQNFSNFSNEENLGKNLFFNPRTQCAACHLANRNNGNNGNGQMNHAIFQPNRTFNNGLDENLVNADNGVGDISGNTNDNGRFKVSSLRNIELTAPYMHDGRFSSLEQVVEHYNSGVQAHPNLDRRLRTGNGNNGTITPRRLNLSQTEKTALVAFLKTLTDTSMLNDVRFSDPFIASRELRTLAISGTPVETRITAQVSNGTETQQSTFQAGETLSVNFSLTPDARHISQMVPIYLLMIHNNEILIKYPDNTWQPWVFGNIASLVPAETLTLTNSQVINVRENFTATTGAYNFHLGYGTNNGDLIYNDEAFRFQVTAP